MPGIDPEQPKKPSWISVWSFVILAVGFAGGKLTDLGSRSQQLQQVITEMQEMRLDLKAFTGGYASFHESVNGSLIKIEAEQQRIEDHLSHNDGRLDRIEARGK